MSIRRKMSNRRKSLMALGKLTPEQRVHLAQNLRRSANLPGWSQKQRQEKRRLMFNLMQINLAEAKRAEQASERENLRKELRQSTAGMSKIDELRAAEVAAGCVIGARTEIRTDASPMAVERPTIVPKLQGANETEARINTPDQIASKSRQQPDAAKEAAAAREIIPPEPRLTTIVQADTRRPSPHRRLLRYVAFGGVLIVVVMVVFAYVQEQRRREAQKDEEARRDQALEAQLLANPSEIERRLRNQISVRDGTALIKNRYTRGIIAIPASTPWAISCDVMGLSVRFADGDEFDGLGARLSSLPLLEEQCAEAASTAARVLRSILGEPSAGGLRRRHDRTPPDDLEDR